MKIKTIRFKNINSLRGEHKIDFESAPFDQSKLFAITGPTGSGKSTLLDVITLSLYNKVPRFTEGKSTISTTDLQKHGSIISRGTKDAYTEVDYEINNKSYTSKWSVRTNRNGKLVGPKMEVANTLDQTLIEGNSNGTVIELNESFIGLNYDQFIKSILLSQGAFDQFLKANKKERGILLEKITGVDIFRKIGAASFDRANIEEQKLEQLKSKLGGMDLLSQDEITAFEMQEIDLDKSLLSINEKILHVQRHLNIKNQVVELREKIEKTKGEILENAKSAADFKYREEKLVKHQKLLAYKADILQFQSIQEEIKKGRSRTNEISAGIENERQRLKENELAKAQLDNQLEKLIHKKHKLIPIIENVRIKDQKIGENEAVLKKSKELFEQHESQRKRLLEKYDARKIALDRFIKRRLVLLDKLTDNPQLEQLRIDFPLIKEKITDVNQTDETLLALNVEWEKLGYALTLPELSAHTIDEIKAIQLKQKVHFKEALEKVEHQDVNTLEALIEKQEQELLILNELIHIEQQYNSIEKESASIKEALVNKEKEYDKLQSSFEKLGLKRKQFELKQTELKAKFDREQLEQNFEELRANLNEGDACPLCGSEEHPFVEHYENHSSDTAKELEQVESTLSKVLADLEVIFENKTKLHSEIASDKQRQNLFAKQSTDLAKALKKVKLLERDSIAAKVEVLNASKVKLRANRMLLTQVAEWDKASLTLNHIIFQLEDIAKINNRLVEMTADYQKYIKDYHIKEWEGRFGEIIEAYQNASQEVNTLDLKITEERGKLDEIEYELKEEAIRVSASQKELNEVHQQLEQIVQERKDLFGEQDPNQVNDQMHQKISREKDQLNVLESNINTLNTGVQIKSKQVKELNKELDAQQSHFKKYESNISKLLEDGAFASIDEMMNSFLSEEELMLLEQEKENLKTLAIRLNQDLKTFEEQLTEIRDFDSEVTLDTLNIELGRYKVEQTKFNQQKGQLFEKLRNDREQRKQVADIALDIETQEKEFKRWKTLKDYIGDKEGNKFSIFAQELTLAHLIELANRRLKVLDDRYVLQKYDPRKKEEDIIVLDTYQGNARRSVKTLSGGETFMISLAMALSLSDLASQNVKIDSLFIDEGFGTLDEEALDKALSTLEQLQIKAKKMIGIISHVAALKERIGTQIQLNKGSDGYSSIEVL
jgi:exonuclease SbcC